MKEEWRPIPGYEGAYEVSSHGRIKSLERIARVAGGWRKVRERILKPKITRHGYFSVSLCRDGAKSDMKVHIAVLSAFPSGSGEITRHLDGNPLNNFASNLRKGTHKENNADRDLHGKTCRGEKNVRSKLKEKDVLEIVKMRRDGEKLSDIGRVFNVTADAVCKIVKGKNWSHITGISA